MLHVLSVVNNNTQFYDLCSSFNLIKNETKFVHFLVCKKQKKIYPVGLFNFVQKKNRKGIVSFKDHKSVLIDNSSILIEKIVKCSNNFYFFKKYKIKINYTEAFVNFKQTLTNKNFKINVDNKELIVNYDKEIKEIKKNKNINSRKVSKIISSKNCNDLKTFKMFKDHLVLTLYFDHLLEFLVNICSLSVDMCKGVVFFDKDSQEYVVIKKYDIFLGNKVKDSNKNLIDNNYILYLPKTL